LWGVAGEAAQAASALSPLSFEAGMGLITSGLKKKTAYYQGIGARGYGVKVHGGIAFYEVLALGMDFGGEYVSDENSFAQDTTAGERTSTTSIQHLSLSAGLRVPAFSLGGNGARRLSLGVDLGKAFYAGGRSISDCDDCAREDLELKGGTYYEPQLALFFKNSGGKKRMGIGVAYRRFASGSDVLNSLNIRWTMQFLR
jgi:hypothetical protein